MLVALIFFEAAVSEAEADGEGGEGTLGTAFLLQEVPFLRVEKCSPAPIMGPSISLY